MNGCVEKWEHMTGYYYTVNGCVEKWEHMTGYYYTVNGCAEKWEHKTGYYYTVNGCVGNMRQVIITYCVFVCGGDIGNLMCVCVWGGGASHHLQPYPF